MTNCSPHNNNKRLSDNKAFCPFEVPSRETKRNLIYSRKLKYFNFCFSFELKAARQNHENQICTLNSDLEEANEKNQKLQDKIEQLCEEIQGLQNLNTEEWSRREQLETEKFQLEREVKKMKHQITDLEVTHSLSLNIALGLTLT